MKSNRFKVFKLSFLMVLFATLSLNAQTDDALENTHNEMKATFGTVPSFFKAFPENALPGAWTAFKNLTGPEAAIPHQYQELIGLAVAAQIPCNYCIYYHTKAAKAYGASDEQIKEAIATGANVRHWSMILQGNQIPLEDFKKEFDAMMKYMAEQAAKK